MEDEPADCGVRGGGAKQGAYAAMFTVEQGLLKLKLRDLITISLGKSEC